MLYRTESIGQLWYLISTIITYERQRGGWQFDMINKGEWLNMGMTDYRLMKNNDKWQKHGKCHTINNENEELQTMGNDIQLAMATNGELQTIGIYQQWGIIDNWDLTDMSNESQWPLTNNGKLQIIINSKWVIIENWQMTCNEWWYTMDDGRQLWYLMTCFSLALLSWENGLTFLSHA